MRFFERVRLGTSAMPRVVRLTIAATLVATFFSLLLHPLFIRVLCIPSPYQMLSLSTWGIHKLFLWQFVSYLLIEPLPSGIHFTLLLSTFLKLYLLWTFGSSLVKLKGQCHFVALYFGGGLFVGLLFYLFQSAFHARSFLAGATPAIYILLISWTFLLPTAHLTLFMMLPMRAHHLVFGMLGVTVLLDVCKGHFSGCLTTISALLFGYLYPLLVWETPGPFPRLQRCDNMLIQFKRKYLKPVHTPRFLEKGKIYDLQTGRIVVQEKVLGRDRKGKTLCPWKRVMTWSKRWAARLLDRNSNR